MQQASDATQDTKAGSSLGRCGLTEEHLSSWHFHVLDLSVERQQLLAEGLLEVAGRAVASGDSSSSSVALDPSKVHRFVDRIRLGYKPNPYHNFAHGIDVTFTLRRAFLLMQQADIFSGVETFAMQVAALGHDIGHEGVNNGFLSATTHPLAVLYNDKSPLENMHCAKLFDILASEESCVLCLLPRSQIKQAYELIRDTVLHTDMTQHAEMVKELNALADECSSASDAGPLSEEACTVLRENKQLVARTMLHAADMSNPGKPFRIAKQWSYLLLDEFMAQGDREKELGLEVQMMNDRDKVSRPLSQIGFIEFVMAPFHSVLLRVLPCWKDTAFHLQENVQTWQTLWLDEAKPDEEEQEKVRQKVAKVVSMLPREPGSESARCTPPILSRRIMSSAPASLTSSTTQISPMQESIPRTTAMLKRTVVARSPASVPPARTILRSDSMTGPVSMVSTQSKRVTQVGQVPWDQQQAEGKASATSGSASTTASTTCSSSSSSSPPADRALTETDAWRCRSTSQGPSTRSPGALVPMTTRLLQPASLTVTNGQKAVSSGTFASFAASSAAGGVPKVTFPPRTQSWQSSSSSVPPRTTQKQSLQPSISQWQHSAGQIGY